MAPVELTAGPLHLRPWRPEDADDLGEAFRDPVIQRTRVVRGPYAPEEARAFVEEVSPRRWATGEAAAFAVLDAATGRLQAGVNLHGLDSPHRSAEVGYWCAAWARGVGVTSAAVVALCRWGFDALALERVGCLAAVDNVASQRTALRAGFTYEGVARRAVREADAQVDAWQAGLLPTDRLAP